MVGISFIGADFIFCDKDIRGGGECIMGNAYFDFAGGDDQYLGEWRNY